MLSFLCCYVYCQSRKTVSWSHNYQIVGLLSHRQIEKKKIHDYIFIVRCRKKNLAGQLCRARNVNKRNDLFREEYIYFEICTRENAGAAYWYFHRFFYLKNCNVSVTELKILILLKTIPTCSTNCWSLTLWLVVALVPRPILGPLPRPFPLPATTSPRPWFLADDIILLHKLMNNQLKKSFPPKNKLFNWIITADTNTHTCRSTWRKMRVNWGPLSPGSLSLYIYVQL